MQNGGGEKAQHRRHTGEKIVSTHTQAQRRKLTRREKAAVFSNIPTITHLIFYKHFRLKM